METNKAPSPRMLFILCLALALASFAIYWQVGGHGFVLYDDDEYVYDNQFVSSGITPQGIAWAFTREHAANWHPVTWLSHMVDVELYGLNPRGHHLTNVLLHTANGILLFLLFVNMTGAVWRSGLVAALFALHPLHVESVAWVAERKDVLSAFFMLLTLFAYVRYTRRRSRSAYAVAILLYSLGLMAKPMLVTLPLVLFVLDLWPLHRMGEHPSLATLRALFPLVKEKAPFFLLACISAVITLVVQQKGGAVQTLESYPLAVRLENGLYAYAGYLAKTIWPAGLAVIYPHPASALPILKTAAAALTLAAMTLAASKAFFATPAIMAGWVWYLVTLIPVIGIVQVGYQSMADRYTYIPLIGVFTIIAWAVPGKLLTSATQRRMAALAAGLVLGGCLVVSYRQVGYWSDNFTLFTRALDVTKNNFVALNHLGMAYFNNGEQEKAVEYFQEAVRVKPDDYSSWSNMGIAYLRLNRHEEAAQALAESVRIKPDYATALNNLGLVRYVQGRFDEAIEIYRRALVFRPDNHSIHDNLGVALLKKGEYTEARNAFAEALRLNPFYAGAHYDMGLVFTALGNAREAETHYREALRIDPEFAPAQKALEALAEGTRTDTNGQAAGEGGKQP